MLSRRLLFGAVPAIAAAAAPVAVHAIEVAKEQTAWERFAEGLISSHPDFAPVLERAKADGWEAHELCYAIGGVHSKRPAVGFERRQEEPDPDRPGWVRRSLLMGSYQEGRDKVGPVNCRWAQVGEAW